MSEKQPRPPPPAPVDPATAVPPEMLNLVRCMCDHFGWMRTESLKLDRTDPRTSKPWIEQLPEALRGSSVDDKIQRGRHTALALRIVRRECKEAGVLPPFT